MITSPYAPHISPYPTRFHGGIWVRPQPGRTLVKEVQSVFMPHQMAGDPAFGESVTTSYGVALAAFVVGAGIGYYFATRKNRP